MSDRELDEALKRNGVPVEEPQEFAWQDAVYWVVVLSLTFGAFCFVMSFVGAWD